TAIASSGRLPTVASYSARMSFTRASLGSRDRISFTSRRAPVQSPRARRRSIRTRRSLMSSGRAATASSSSAFARGSPVRACETRLGQVAGRDLEPGDGLRERPIEEGQPALRPRAARAIAVGALELAERLPEPRGPLGDPRALEEDLARGRARCARLAGGSL